MITNENLKSWLTEQGIKSDTVIDSRTGTEVHIFSHFSDAAAMNYEGVLAIPTGHFIMIKVVGAPLEKYHPRKCMAVLQQFNGLLNRRKTADSYNYNVENGRLIIVFWPENTTTDRIHHYLDLGFDRLDFMYRNLEKLDIAD